MSLTPEGVQFQQKLILLTERLSEDAMKVFSELAEKRVKQNIINRVRGDGVKGDNSGSFSSYRNKSHINKRKKRGLTTSKKNFSFSGGMIDSIKIKKKTSWYGGFEISIGFTGRNNDADRPRSRGKLNSLVASYHGENESTNMMQQTTEEKQELQRELMFYIENQIRTIR